MLALFVAATAAAGNGDYERLDTVDVRFRKSDKASDACSAGVKEKVTYVQKRMLYWPFVYATRAQVSDGSLECVVIHFKILCIHRDRPTRFPPSTDKYT